MNILQEITEKTAEDLRRRKNKVSFNALHSMEGFEKNRISFRQGLLDPDPVSVIAEVKKASPSKGLIRADFDPVRIAESYEKGGASAISVLTDEPFFKGHLDFMASVARKVSLPVLRKDFVIDPYQVKEARAYGADAVLIIVAITEGDQLHELIHACREFELDALVECYGEEDLNRVDFSLADILGVNNRDLRNFDVDLHRGVGLLNRAPEGTVLVSESGLSKPADLQLLIQNNIQAALIGEYFMKKEDPGKAVSDLIEGTKQILENV